MVSTLDFESSNPSSNLGGTSEEHFIVRIACFTQMWSYWILLLCSNQSTEYFAWEVTDSLKSSFPSAQTSTAGRLSRNGGWWLFPVTSRTSQGPGSSSSNSLTQTASQNLRGTKASSPPRGLLSRKPRGPRSWASPRTHTPGVTSYSLFPFPFHPDSSLPSLFSHSFFSFSSSTPNAKPDGKLLENLQPRRAQSLQSKQKS